MEYKKIIKNNYTFHLIKTDRFKTIGIDVHFSNKFNKKDVAYFNLLSKMLVTSTKKYKNIKDLAIYGEELYGAEVSTAFNTSGNIERMVVSLDFLNPKYTEKSMLNKSIDFLRECLFNPDISNGEFNNKIFELNKNNMLTNLKNIQDNPYAYSYIRFKEIMYKNNSVGVHLFNNIKELENINSKDLYEFYLNVLFSFKIDIFITGDLENEEEYIKNVENLFEKINNNFNDVLSFDIREEKATEKEIKETKNFSQSHLFVGYQFLNLTDYEKRYILNFYNSILGGINNSLLFTEVREKNSLCYSVGSFIIKYPASIVIETEISGKNYLKTLNLINSTIKKMKNKKNLLELFNTTKENINTSLNAFYDDKNVMVEHFYSRQFSGEEDVETRREKYMKVTLDEVIALNNKINKDTVYFLEGNKE